MRRNVPFWIHVIDCEGEVHTFYAKPGDAVNLIEALAIDATGYDAEANGRSHSKAPVSRMHPCKSIRMEPSGHRTTTHSRWRLQFIIDLDGTRPRTRWVLSILYLKLKICLLIRDMMQERAN